MYCKIRFEGYKFFLEDMVIVRNGSTDARGSNDGKKGFLESNKDELNRGIFGETRWNI